MNELPDDLATLIQELIDGSLSDSQRRSLLDSIQSDERVRKIYLEHIGTHTALRSVMSSPLLSIEEQQVSQFPNLTTKAYRTWDSWRFASLATLCAAILGAILLTNLWHNSNQPLNTETPSFAKLLSSHDASFDVCDMPTQPGSQLSAGTLRLKSGDIDLQFDCGATLKLKGPAVLRLKSAMHAVLESGRVECEVPEQAIGFRIEATDYSVIDLGTRFELESNDDRRWVRVLEGKVDIQPRSGDKHRLNEGQTARIELGRVAIPQAKLQEIPLGNLFDDPVGTPLDIAIRTDRKGASATVGMLGIERVVRAEQFPGTEQSISPNVRLQLAPLGWCEMSSRGVLNDTWCQYTLRPIVTEGDVYDANQAGEQGIGIHACQFVTFDLPAIRQAGDLLSDHLAFVADRVGLNLDQPDDSRVNLAVVASSETEVLNVWVNGREVAFHEDSSVTLLQEPMPRYAWRFSPVNFFCPLSDKAKFLTLISSADKDAKIQGSHGVFSGARLKVGSVNTWRFDNGEVIQKGQLPDQRFLFGDGLWTDYEFSFDAMKIGGREGFLAMIRSVDENEFCWVNLGGWGNERSQIERKLSGQPRQKPIGDASSFIIDENRWYQIRVRCEGNRIQVFVDHESIIDYQDDGQMSPRGKVGIGTWSTEAKFRNFKVESLDGRILFKALQRESQNPVQDR